MDVENLDKALVAKALNYHGLQLQKIFETEYPNFQTLKLDSLDFNDYSKRQKTLSFQDRGKRFRLQQFIGKHANKLFIKNRNPVENLCDPNSPVKLFPVLPPFEWFMNVEKELRLQRFFEYIKVGDIIIATVVNKSSGGIMLKILYGECGNDIRCVPDIGIKAFCPLATFRPAVDKKTNGTRSYLLNDIVCCEVLEVNTDTEKIVCGMKGNVCLPHNQARLGLINSDAFAPVYRKFQEKKRDQTYNSLLANSEEFFNANFVPNQLAHLGLPDELYTHFKYLKEKFPLKESARELRQVQASKWSFRGVAEGIEHFKAGRYTEAFQCLNKALTIDRKNIEALVARGALYANSSNYEKAISDFEAALKFNPNHQNAKKYLGDTLIAYGRTYEENNKFEEAAKTYERCLLLIPTHEEAQNSLQFLKNRLLAKKESDDNQLDPEKVRELYQLLSQGDDKSILRELKKLRKKKAGANSSSSSSSDSSADSSNDSSSSSESSSPDKKKKKLKKESSLSPLSKRMALMESHSVMPEAFPTAVAPPVATYNPNLIQYSQQAGSSFRSAPENNGNFYDTRFMKILEETKKGDYHEEQVRKFLEETAKWRREKSREARKKKKKEKLRQKKKKKDTKKKKKKDDKKHHKKHSSGSGSEFLEQPFSEKQLNLNSLKDLEELQTKLSAYYSKVEKASSKSKKDSHKDKEERASKHKIKEVDDNYVDDIHAGRVIDKPRHDSRTSSYEDEKPPPEAASGFKFKMQVSHRQIKVRKRDEEDPFWGEDKNLTDDEMGRNDAKSPTVSKMSLPMSHRRSRSRSPGRGRSAGPSRPSMDKRRSYSIKKDLPSPKRGSYRSKSRSKSIGRLPRYRSRSLSRRRYSRSRSRSRSYHRRRYSRYSRSRSYSRTRSRTRSRSNSPYYRDRIYRGRGTYYRPRSSSGFRGSGYRGSNWRSNFNGRGRAFSPRARPPIRRPYPNRPYSSRSHSDYRSRRSSEEITEWRDSSRERSRERSRGRSRERSRERSKERSTKRNEEDDRRSSPLRFAGTPVATGEPSAPGTEPTN